MPSKEIKIWSIEEEQDLLKIRFYRKYSDSINNSIISVIVIGLIFLAVGIGIAISRPHLLAISILMGTLALMMGALLILQFKYKTEVQQLEITPEWVIISKSSWSKVQTRKFERKQIVGIRMDQAEVADEFVTLFLFLTSPILMLVLGMGAREPAPAFRYLGKAHRFFEFGTNAQKMWILKYLSPYFNN